MNLKFIKQDNIDRINSNISELYKQIIVNDKSLEEYLDEEKVIEDANISVNDFTLDVSAEKPVSTDLENIKRVYSALKTLTASQASDERIWLAYSLGVCKEYMKYRWPAKDMETLSNRWLFGYTIRRSLFRHGIARLWWIAQCTFDGNRPDPFELTAYVVNKQDIINQLLDIGFNGNKDLVIAIIDALRDAEKGGKTIGREEIRSVSRYINSLGGIYLIDSLTKDDIYTKVKKILS